MGGKGVSAWPFHLRGLKQRSCNWESLRTLFAGRRAVVFQRQHGELVDGGEAREVGGVLLCRAEDELALLLDAVFLPRQYSIFQDSFRYIVATHVPDLKRKTMLWAAALAQGLRAAQGCEIGTYTSAWGKRTLAP